MVETESKQNKLKKKFIEKKNIILKNTKRAALLFWADLIWYIHFAVVILAVGLFFIPLSYLPNRITIHFYFLWSVIFLQVFIGLIYMIKTKRFQFVCPLTAAEKHLVKRHPHKHVGESCVADFCAEKLGLPKWLGTISVLLCLGIVTAQYFKVI